VEKPEYWEEDEVWDAYEQWLKDNPSPAPRAQSKLEQAVEDARGGPAPVPLRGYA
jgi:hypothetical protein